MTKDNKVDLIDLMEKHLGKDNPETLKLLKEIGDDVISELLKWKSVAWHNMFSLELTRKPLSTRRNPKTDEEVFVPPKKSIKLKIGKALEERLKKELTEKNMLIFTKEPDKFQKLIEQLKEYKIVTEVIVPSSDQPLKEKFTETKNVSSMLIDFPPESAEYDEITSLAKIDKMFSQAALMNFIPANYDTMRIPGFKIICDRWIKTSTPSDELIKIIVDGTKRTEEELLFKEHIRFRIPTESTHVEKTVGVLEQLIGRSKLSPERANVFLFSIQEAITNGVLHGNLEKKDKYLEMEYLIDKQKVQFKVKDEGPGFDYETYIKKTESSQQYIIEKAKSMAPRKGTGIGIISMRRCVDEITYTPPGNALSITKYLKAPKNR
ncbi:MAG: ATP-binding protein [Planctomycetota bacterium]